MDHDGRFAPSPTGPLHLGSLRTALVAWLMARSSGSRFLLRIEDLDPQRSRREFEALQLADLSALGIDWDEPPVRQSERTQMYVNAVSELQAAGRLYPCFCTRAEIRDAASAPHASLPDAGSAPHASLPDAGSAPHASLPQGAYPGTCRAIAPSAAQQRIARGERYALRLRAQEAVIEYVDRLLGPQAGTVDDFVVVRSDGVHAYQLAVVVDDAAQGIGEVVRGADLADSTPRQILLQKLLGLPTPAYAHVGLVLGPDGRRLAKRDQGSTIADRSESASGTLALLAPSLGLDQRESPVERAADLLADFEPERIPRGPVHMAS
jgi:glutamyl-tRNA synthetase